MRRFELNPHCSDEKSFSYTPDSGLIEIIIDGEKVKWGERSGQVIPGSVRIGTEYFDDGNGCIVNDNGKKVATIDYCSGACEPIA